MRAMAQLQLRFFGDSPQYLVAVEGGLPTCQEEDITLFHTADHVKQVPLPSLFDSISIKKLFFLPLEAVHYQEGRLRYFSMINIKLLTWWNLMPTGGREKLYAR